MNEQPVKSHGKGVILRRIRLSLVLGVSITVVFVFLGSIFPFSITKFLFWPALLFVKVHDEELGAPFFYMIGVPVSLVAYSLIIYVYLTVRGLPHPQANRNNAK